MTSMHAGTPRIVVGVDGSRNSLVALCRAADEARTRGAGLELVYVLPPGSAPAAIASGYAMLDMSVRCCAPDGLDVPAHRMVAGGDPAQILVELSEDAAVLVVGARLNSESGNLLGGDVVSYCLSRARCPIDICADHQAHARRADARRAQRARAGSRDGAPALALVRQA